MKEEGIHIETYNPEWVKKFDKEKELIQRTLGSWVDGGIHHVGSTAVPGLAAKPIVDIMVGVNNLEAAKECIPMLGTIGYSYADYRSDVMHWFCKPSPEHREFHLYLIERSHSEWKARLAFRDYLRSHSDAAETYEKLKRELSKKHHDDREAYTAAKADFILATITKALGT